MDAFEWTSKYVTGIPVVDSQHQRLVELVNAFGEATAGGANLPAAEVERVFGELAHYAVVHFSDEEQLMRARGIDPRFFEYHARQHAVFLNEVKSMHAGLAVESAEAPRMLLRFLINWLAFHILGSDQQMARQLADLDAGRSAAEAYALEVHGEDNAASLLLGAVDDLLRMLGQRNRQLVDANASLERRVAERTAELSERNHELSQTLAQLKATQQHLVESEKLASVGQLASGMAHEINNPLGFIRSNVGALGDASQRLLALVDAYDAHVPQQLEAARQAADLDYLRQDLGDLLQETNSGLDRVQAIVKNLKDFSRVDEAAVQPVDLAQAVTSALAVLPPSRRAGVTFTTEFASVEKVAGHGAQLNQALFNLLSNASQAVQDTHAPGTVTVRVGAQGPRAFVEVEDTGVGMADEVKAHLFEPFFTTRPPGQGLGLGLSVVWSCAQRHGGTVEAVSTQGRGARFRLWLPREGTPVDLGEAARRSNAFNTRRYAAT